MEVRRELCVVWLKPQLPRLRHSFSCGHFTGLDCVLTLSFPALRCPSSQFTPSTESPYLPSGLPFLRPDLGVFSWFDSLMSRWHCITLLSICSIYSSPTHYLLAVYLSFDIARSSCWIGLLAIWLYSIFDNAPPSSFVSSLSCWVGLSSSGQCLWWP